MSSEAERDLDLLKALRVQVAPLMRRAATEVHALERADVVVLLISPDFLSMPESELIEKHVLLRQRQGGCEVIPVVIRPCAWQLTSLADLPALPSDGRPVTAWNDLDAALTDVVEGIRRAIRFADPARRPDSGPSPLRPQDALRADLPIERIFKVKGQPDLNYVEPSQSAEIRDRLRNMGHGLVVEGPSGVGKTTAVKKALEVLDPQPPPIWISSKKKSDLVRLREVLDADLRPGGHLVVDDFHRLDAEMQQTLADLMKILADEDREDAKLTLIGINPVGVSLVRGFPDLANRFAVISMGRHPDEKIDELIVKGEGAANITFRQRPEFVTAAAGSFFTAQLLCYEAALKEGIHRTQHLGRVVETGPYGYVSDKVQQNLAFKYHAPLLAFASCDERPPPRGACLTLLWLLMQSRDRSISLETARFRYPQLQPAFDWLMASNLSRRFADVPRLAKLFYYNRDAAVLSAEDPQLEFYLRNLRWEALARDTGHEKLTFEPDLGPVFGPTQMESSPEAATVILSALPPSYILHLSDLHFGTREHASIWSEQLIRDLRMELQCERLDVVAVSGDISNRATVDEYQAAGQFLLDLKQDYRLSPQQIVLVPGNHDVSWERAKSAYAPLRRGDHKGMLEDGEYIDGGDYIEVKDQEEYRKRFLPFADFCHEVLLEPYPLDYERQATLHHYPAQRLLLLGLNSAWALDHHFRGRAGIHQVALGQALRLVRKTAAYADCLKIAVWHHPLSSSEEDRIKDTSFLEQLAQGGFRLGLHGHIHRAKTEIFHHDMTPAGRRLDVLCAGTFGAPVREWVPGYPLQYQLLRIADGRVTVMTRRRIQPGGAWMPDACWLQGPGQDPLPRYDVVI